MTSTVNAVVLNCFFIVGLKTIRGQIGFFFNGAGRMKNYKGARGKRHREQEKKIRWGQGEWIKIRRAQGVRTTSL